MNLSNNDEQQYFLLDVFIGDLKNMSTDNIVNSSLLTVGTSLTAFGVLMIQTNFWYGIVSILVGFASYALREVLP